MKEVQKKTDWQFRMKHFVKIFLLVTLQRRDGRTRTGQHGHANPKSTAKPCSHTSYSPLISVNWLLG